MELRIISSENKLNPEDTIIIDTSSDKPVLVYNNQAIDTSIIARNDHLDFLLRRRDWNIGNRLYLGQKGRIKMSLKDYQDSSIPEVEEANNDIDFEEDGNIDIQNEINKLYNKAFRFDDIEYKKLYKIIRAVLSNVSGNLNNIEFLEKDYIGVINFNRFLNSDYIIDSNIITDTNNLPNSFKSSLIDSLQNYFKKYKVNSEEALDELITSTYDFKHIIDYDISPNNFIAKVTVVYSYLEKKELKSVSEEVVIRPFDINRNKLNSKYYTKDKRVLAEVYDGVLRVFPLVPEIRECIIQNCILISEEYEKL